MKEDIKKFLEVKDNLEVKIAQKLFNDCIGEWNDIEGSNIIIDKNEGLCFIIATTVELDEQDLKNIRKEGFQVLGHYGDENYILKYSEEL